MTFLRKAPRYASLHFLQIVYTLQFVLILPPFSVSMPKAKLAGKSYVRQLPGGEYVWHYNADNDQVLCKICSCGFGYSASNVTYRVNKHMESEKHKSGTEASTSRQQTINQLSFLSSTPKTNVFRTKLTQMLVSANIPVFKVENEKFKSFMEKWTGQVLPSESSIRKSYLPIEYENTVKTVRDKIADNDYYIQIDEATDANGRSIFAVLIGLLKDIEKPYLIEVRQVEKVPKRKI